MIASDDCIRRSELIMHLSDWAFSEAPLQDNHDQNIVYDTIQTCIQAVERMPSADVIERKKGKWEKHNDDVVYWWQCSECQCVAFFEDALTPYCPHCGAEMERSEE